MMPNFKTTGDLSDNPASIGGAMGKWPLRTLWWLCRQERTMATDPNVVESIQGRNLRAINHLIDSAEEVGIGTETLTRRYKALRDSEVSEMRDAISRAYRSRYGAGIGSEDCPFEREGTDMACHRCPVAGMALRDLSGEESIDVPSDDRGDETKRRAEKGAWDDL